MDVDDALLRAHAELERAADLPYRAAFDAQELPPVPPALQARVHELLAASVVAASPLAGPARHGPARRGWLVGALVASFVAGLLVPRPWLQGLSPQGPAAGGHGDAAEPWIAAIAQYHALYVRETVQGQTASFTSWQDLLADVAPALRVRLRGVPDLRARGYAFKRAQRLGHGAEPLIQLVYLPVQGRPLALCFLPAPGAARAPRFETLCSQGVASWRDAGLAFVVVGDLPAAELQPLVALIQAQFQA